MNDRADRLGARRARSGDLDARSDEELLALLRAGEERGFGELFRRHRPSAVKYAARLLQRSSRSDAAEDVVSDAFRKILAAVRNGNGPVDNFRPYLYASVRAMAFDHLRANRHENLVEPPSEFAASTTPNTDALVAFDAFRTLPRRWQEVLWATKVMSLTPSEFGVRTGLRANSAAALSLRARDGLRIAYVRAHLPAGRSASCREALDVIARRCVGSADRSSESALDDHLLDCADCRGAADELRRHLPTAAHLRRWPQATVA